MKLVMTSELWHKIDNYKDKIDDYATNIKNDQSDVKQLTKEMKLSLAKMEERIRLLSYKTNTSDWKRVGHVGDEGYWKNINDDYRRDIDYSNRSKAIKHMIDIYNDQNKLECYYNDINKNQNKIHKMLVAIAIAKYNTSVKEDKTHKMLLANAIAKEAKHIREA